MQYPVVMSQPGPELDAPGVLILRDFLEKAIDAILKYMRPVAIIGIGKTAFGAFPDRDLRSLAVEAVEQALSDGGVQPPAVEAFYLGNFAGPSFVGQNHLAPYVGSAAGFSRNPLYTL